MTEIPKMKLTRALRPKSLEMYNLDDLCRWVKHGWPELEDVDFFPVLNVDGPGITKLEYSEDTLYNDDEWEYFLAHNYNFADADRENLILFYMILRQEFGDCYIVVDW